MAVARRDDVLVVLAALLPLALFAVRERAIAHGAGFPLDDAWIHLHFARNVAEGAGFAYNPGRPVAGSTAPLWTLVLAIGTVVAGASVVMAKVMGTAATIAAGVLTRRAALAWGAPPAPALVASVALLWTGAMAWGALSGMELGLAAMLVAAALLAHARGRLVATALLAALAVLARPEAIVLIPLFMLSGRPRVRRLLVFCGITAVVLAPAVIFSLATVGAPMPATAVAKIEGGLIGWLSGVREPAILTFCAFAPMVGSTRSFGRWQRLPGLGSS